MARPPGIMLIGTAALGGCASLLQGGDEPVPLPVRAGVQVGSGPRLGSGCLVFASRRHGSFVLTAAHLVGDRERALVAFHPAGGLPVWRTARVLRVDHRLDLALLWCFETVFRAPQRVVWNRRSPPPGSEVQLLVGAAGGPRAFRGKVVEGGRLRADRPFTRGMSGAGVFHNGRLSGILYGRRRSRSESDPPEGRFLTIEKIRSFLSPGFGFLAAGRLPAEPR